MLSIRQIEYLVALADSRHFRRAAEHCGVSQPTLSAQLKALETQLGAQLVERVRSGVVFTPLGEQVLGIARRILLDAQEIRDLALSFGKGLGGTVRLGLPPSIGPYLLAKMLPNLHREYPELRIFVREEIPQTLPRSLQAGRYEVLITPLPIKGADIHTRALFREPLYVAMASDHPLAQKPAIERSDLYGESIMTLESGHQLHEQVETICEEIGARLRFDLEGPSLETLWQMVGMGSGLSFLPGLFVRSVIDQDETVTTRPIKGPPIFRTIGVAWRKSSQLVDQYEAFADYVHKTIEREFPDFVRL
ncbi:MAG: hydrogen peroxide-inducible genes activator [Tepidamorphaceae bacterium]